MKTVNPATGEIIKEYEAMSFEQVDGFIKQAQTAQQDWASVGFEERGKLLRKIAELLRADKEKFSRLMAEEMGKPLQQGEGEVEKCAWVCEYYADNAEDFLAQEPVETDASKSYVTFNPLGVVLSIMPWNFPLWQLFRFAAPGLMAGNAIILKHAENVSGCALEIEKLLHDAGIPHDVFRTILMPSDKLKPVIQHEGVAAITLTGSTGAGKAVASQAGEVIKKTVLELGGSDPYIILEDADLKKTVEACVTSRLINSGQSCIAAKRFIVIEKVYDEFVDRFTELMESKRMGDPFEEGTDIGPLARQDLRDDLHQQVQRSISKGAKLLTGGAIPDRGGAYYPPTVLGDVKSGMPAYDEELFGPVAAITKVKNVEEAVKTANDSVYGLGAAIFSSDVDRAEQIAATQLEAGCCFVNDFVRSDPRLPFGGVKESGYGRELGLFGIREFVNIKTVYVK